MAGEGGGATLKPFTLSQILKQFIEEREGGAGLLGPKLNPPKLYSIDINLGGGIFMNPYSFAIN